MKTEIKVTVPTEVEDITVGQYQEYMVLLGGIKEEEFKIAKTTEFFRIKLVSIFCNIPIEVVRDSFTIDDVSRLANQIASVLTTLQEKKEHKIQTEFTVHNVEFGFEPDFEKMSAGAFADLSSYFGDWTNAHRVMAVLYRPITKRKKNRYLGINQYELEPYNGTDEWAELMKLLPVIRLLEVNFTLLHLYKRLRLCFLDYTQEIVQMELKSQDKEKLILLKRYLTLNGDGIKPFIQ